MISRKILQAILVAVVVTAVTSETATVGVLHNTEQGRLLAKMLTKWESDIKTHLTDEHDCVTQLKHLMKMGIHRFVNLCDTPVSTEDEVMIVTPGACRDNDDKCTSVKLPAHAQWTALAAVMKQLDLERVMITEEDAVLREVMTKEAIEVDQASDMKLSEPEKTMVVIGSMADLARMLERFGQAQLLHWFVPDAARLGSAAVLESADMQRLIGTARLYTVQTGVSSAADLPSIPAGSTFSDTALAVDAVTVARGGAPQQGTTGDLHLENGSRLTGHADVLLWRPQQQVITATAAVHADGWVPIAAIRDNTLQPPSVHYVLPSRLVSTLSSPAACEAGLVTVIGTDAISGRNYNRQYPAGNAPRALLVYGQRPFRVGLECEGVHAEYRCHTGANSVSCLRRDPMNVNNTIGDAVVSRSKREAELPLSQYRTGRRYHVDRTGYKPASNKVKMAAPMKSFENYEAINGASGYENPAPFTVNREGELARHSDSIATASDRDAVIATGDQVFVHGGEFPAPVGYRPHAPQAVQQYVWDTNPSPAHQKSITFNGAAVRQGSGSGRNIILPLLPDMFGCAGSIGGCGFCISYYTSSSAGTPEGCAAPCSVAIGGTCATVVGVLLKTLAEEA